MKNVLEKRGNSSNGTVRLLKGKGIIDMWWFSHYGPALGQITIYY